MKNPVASNTTTSLNNLNKSGAPYPFKSLCKNPLNGNGKTNDHVYTFISKRSGQRYQANAIEYDIGVYAVKFHLRKDKKNPNKYRVLTNSGDAIVVLKTIVGIMLDVLSKDHKASFAFIGMPLEKENLDTTKRYCVYEKFCQRYFSTDTFEHFYDKSNSFYMLINKKNRYKKNSIPNNSNGAK